MWFLCPVSSWSGIKRPTPPTCQQNYVSFIACCTMLAVTNKSNIFSWSFASFRVLKSSARFAHVRLSRVTNTCMCPKEDETFREWARRGPLPNHEFVCGSESNCDLFCVFEKVGFNLRQSYYFRRGSHEKVAFRDMFVSVIKPAWLHAQQTAPTHARLTICHLSHCWKVINVCAEEPSDDSRTRKFC